MASFYASKRFNPIHHFPYGLARSGEFNRKQVALLEQHGESYSALESGDSAPKDQAEKRFIEVCEGMREARSEHEKVWMLYRKKVNSKMVASPFGSSSTKQDFKEDMATSHQDLDAF